MSLHPWANGPFELLLHAEGHLRKGDDFDRRIALIGFDNAIEVSITTYLSLHPIQRGNKQYRNEDMENWLKDYHTKLAFLEAELTARGLTWQVEKSHIIWAHDHRNEQYHGGTKGTPEKQVLGLIRKAAFWIFGLLFDVTNVDMLLEEALLATLPPVPPQRDLKYDRAIDKEHGMVEIAGHSYHTSEALFTVDDAAYNELGAQLCDLSDEASTEENRE